MMMKDFRKGSARRFPSSKSAAQGPTIVTKKKPRDMEYEAQDGVAEALEAVRSDAPLIMLSGSGGTGKSRLVRYLKDSFDTKRQLEVAPTGIAAMNIGCSTIHSTFRLPLGVVYADQLRRMKSGTATLAKIERLVIDEKSMVRADTLDGIDARLRQILDPNKPFGGVQVILVGDFLQLPPVVKGDDARELAALGYDSPFAFSAKVLQDMPMKVITLRKVWRQSDKEMIGKLRQIRENRRVEDAVAWFNERCLRAPREGSQPMILTPTRGAAATYNQKGVAAQIKTREAEGLDTTPTLFEAKRKGSFEESNQTPAPEQLSLIPGVRVIALRNDQAGRFVNGSLGTVTAIEPPEEKKAGHVTVRFDHTGDEVDVAPIKWEDKRASVDNAGDMGHKVAGTYEQIPLDLGYATTIHKSQGMTLHDMRLDIGRGAFAPGQVYVALSRASNMEGLSFAAPLKARDIHNNALLEAFFAWIADNEKIDVTVAKDS